MKDAPNHHSPIISYASVSGMTKSPTSISASANDTISQFCRCRLNLGSFLTARTTRKLPPTITIIRQIMGRMAAIAPIAVKQDGHSAKLEQLKSVSFIVSSPSESRSLSGGSAWLAENRPSVYTNSVSHF